ncbi:hypothetical protein BKA59DRAFT_510624 [Fusarium tricinctum]|uniref:Uncharacterized protein n=1 Tax=Fusarium tricinctum TaxID=61284 RepID=A0A8K0WDM7_9HYPO|nr:hypothetical protein BKA59DRAFT_510624 [Fusarium tricinctum]
MAALIVHPIWQQDYQRFIGVLSYAVICRLDECRKFAPRDDECPVLRILNQRIDLEEGLMLREPLHKMHSEARKAVRRQRNGDKPSALSNLLYALGKSITTMDPTKNEAESLEQDILPFNLQDLRSLKDAIDKQAQHKFDESYTTFKELVNLSVELPSKNDLRQWDARAVTYLFRRYENEARFGSVTPGPDVEDDDIEEDVTSDEVEEESERPAGIPIFGFEATDSNPTARSDVAVESPQHLNDDHIEPELSDEEGFNPQADDIGPSIEVPSGNAGASHRLRSPPPPPPPSPPQWAYHSFTPRPSNNRRPTLGDVLALRIAIHSRNNAQMREDIDNLMAQPSMGEAEIRQLIRDENSSLQSLIQDHAEENRGLQARLEAHEEDSQRLQTQLDQEKRKRQKGRETQWQRYRLLEAEVRSLKEEGRRYGLLEAEVQSLKERLDAQSTMSLPVVPQQTEDPQQAEEHVSETHDATSPEPRDQDRATFLASAPEGGSMAFHASCGT